ncbi:hypothetical protein HOH45_01385 [bacterium]|jgi:hypothetical protein|nr:hypothetical protein [bacterium]
MNKLKMNGLVLAVLLLMGGTSVWAHSDAPHKQDPHVVKYDVKETLNAKSVPEVWLYIDKTVRNLAVAMKEKYGSKKSKEELIRLKKALDVLKKKQMNHHEGMKLSTEAKKGVYKMPLEKHGDQTGHH